MVSQTHAATPYAHLHGVQPGEGQVHRRLHAQRGAGAELVALKAGQAGLQGHRHM